MATVYKYLQTRQEFDDALQGRSNLAEHERRKRFLAVLLLQRMARGYLIRKHVAWLSYNATIIQCAFRVHRAKKAYRAALRRAVRNKHAKHYAIAATMIQALFRGHRSRRVKFCYRSYRNWLANVTERGERRAAEAAEFGIRSRADDLRILEEEARQWLAFVVFKLHHLLRTYTCAGIYSDPATNELSEFEKLLNSIRYTEYMKRLRRKYDEFVRKHKPKFLNKRLFPIIGEGADYWYLSLPEMYEITKVTPPKPNTRMLPSYCSPNQKKIFLWKKVSAPDPSEGRGPFKPSKIAYYKAASPSPPAPAPTPLPVNPTGDAPPPQKDPRFNLYVKHYRPQPDLIDYVDFHINALLKHKCSMQNMTK